MGMWARNVKHKGQHIKRPRKKVPRKKVGITYCEQERQPYILHLLKSQNTFLNIFFSQVLWEAQHRQSMLMLSE